LSLAFVGEVFAVSTEFSEIDGKTVVEDDFQQLSEPERKVAGAYYGVGLMMSRIADSTLVSHNGNEREFKKTAVQPDLSAILGFGSAFFERYYAGVELRFFKRFAKNTSHTGELDGYRVALTHCASYGMDMDVRFGIQLPKRGALIYLTAGFARIIGETAIYRGDDPAPRAKRSFGSFYPTVGMGGEYKLNHDWNVRVDARLSVTSRDSRGNILRDSPAEVWTAAGKPNRMALGISFTRNI
jgi:hypothetical protein